MAWVVWSAWFRLSTRPACVAPATTIVLLLVDRAAYLANRSRSA